MITKKKKKKRSEEPIHVPEAEMVKVMPKVGAEEEKVILKFLGKTQPQYYVSLEGKTWGFALPKDENGNFIEQPVIYLDIPKKIAEKILVMKPDDFVKMVKKKKEE